MATCEKCWSDAFMASMDDPSVGQVEHYYRLIEERKDNPCTPKEQCGEAHFAGLCDTQCRCGKYTRERNARLGCGQSTNPSEMRSRE